MDLKNILLVKKFLTPVKQYIDLQHDFNVRVAKATGDKKLMRIAEKQDMAIDNLINVVIENIDVFAGEQANEIKSIMFGGIGGKKKRWELQ